MAKTIARLVTRSARLSEEFGSSYAERLFGREALADLPRYTRGKNAGKLKGSIVWVKAEAGGWSRQYGVCRPGLVRAWIVPGYDGSESDAVSGMFLGRVQRLAASVSLLGEENRAAEAARQAEAQASAAISLAEMTKGLTEGRRVLREQFEAGNISEELYQQIDASYENLEAKGEYR